MQKTKLAKFLISLSKDEFNEFEKFVASPFFSRGRNLTEFLRSLKPYYPDFDENQCTVQSIFSSLYPGKKFEGNTSVNQIQKLSSELFKLGKEFFIHTGLKEDAPRQHFYLLNRFREKKLHSEFLSECEKTSDFRESKKIGNINDFLDKYYLTHSMTEYYIDKSDWQNAYESQLLLTEYIIISTLIKAYRNIDTNSAAARLNVRQRYNLADTLIKHIDSPALLDDMKNNNDRFYIYAAVSFEIHNLYAVPDSDEAYFRLKKIFWGNLEMFGNQERYVILCTLSGYCGSKEAENEIKKLDLFMHEGFEIFEKMFKINAYKYSESDKMSITLFRNAVIYANYVDEIDWIENIVQDYLLELHEEHQESMKHFAYAIIHFARKEFEIALDDIMNIKYEFLLSKIDVKNLMFKIYYELGHFEQAIYLVDAIKHYISNTQELPEYFKNRHSTFLKYAIKIIRIKTGSSGHDIDLILREFSEEKSVESKKWLHLKIIELMNAH